MKHVKKLPLKLLEGLAGPGSGKNYWTSYQTENQTYIEDIQEQLLRQQENSDPEKRSATILKAMEWHAHKSKTYSCSGKNRRTGGSGNCT